MMNIAPDQAVILIAEDSEDDIALIRRAFRKAGLLNPVQVVRDGEETIAYLKGELQYANRVEYPLPGLLLLACISPALTHLHAQPYWERAIQGAIILLAVVGEGAKRTGAK